MPGITGSHPRRFEENLRQPQQGGRTDQLFHGFYDIGPGGYSPKQLTFIGQRGNLVVDFAGERGMTLRPRSSATNRSISSRIAVAVSAAKNWGTIRYPSV
ncbi:MAG: hypothetical protein IPL78_30550 [Chloroflexi bacterium]|nr:hypothetical protein [Chloroflexota bacterium]